MVIYLSIIIFTLLIVIQVSELRVAEMSWPRNFAELGSKTPEAPL